MKIRHFLLLSLAILMLHSSAILGQEIITVKGAEGEAAITGSISENDARNQALQSAKVDALRKAGIAENLSSYEMLFKGEAGKDFTELFSSQTQSEIRGAVKSYTAVEEKFVDPSTKLFTIKVTIDAQVIKYKTEQDPEFQVQVDGIKPLYSNNDLLQFTVRVTKDCFLNIFSVTENEASLIFPNKYETEMNVAPGKTITFPKKVDYVFEKKEQGLEHNRLIFVFTKSKIEFIDFTGEDQISSVEKILSWIYSINPDQRRIVFAPTIIR
ncbi:MAG TPA: DUF4384 domain-containing protein [Williamwhitmania sp.]|nr:DUF4384 domain-containing protein [Williamwhitmania sp.]